MRRRYLIEMCIFLAAAWLGVLGLIGIRIVNARSGGILLAATEESDRPGAEQIRSVREQEAKEEESIDFTAWNETEETVMSLDGCRRVQMTVVRLLGSSEYLIPYGATLQDWDSEGCLIGEETAEALFGSRKAEGLTVSCGGREYVVRGVVASPAKLLMIVDNTGEFACDYIALGYRGANRRGVAEAFLLRHGLSMRLAEQTGFRRTFAVTELLPGKWSDFDGWKRNFTAWREGKIAQKSIAPSVFVTEAQGKRNAAAGELAAGVLLFAAGIFETNRTRRDL